MSKLLKILLYLWVIVIGIILAGLVSDWLKTHQEDMGIDVLLQLSGQAVKLSLQLVLELIKLVYKTFVTP